MRNHLCRLSATELVRLIRSKEVSARDVTSAHLARIEAVNPLLNAVVTLDADKAMAAAGRADEAHARGEALGLLHGLPVAHKDLFLTRGMRTTFGSPIFERFIPAQDSIVVERQRRAGAITLGKTNTPEFGAGSQTFNTVFGSTRNPYDPSKTCGGSSGGAAVALATGMVALADGSDLGGSLRNPAKFCNVVGLRPSIGRVPQWPSQDAWGTLAVPGPMARTVEDVALFLRVLAGPDARDPISLADDGDVFGGSLQREFAGTRVAWSADLGGLPVEPAVTAVLESQRGVFTEMGCDVDETSPDLNGADEVFQTLRGVSMASSLGPLLDQHPAAFKETIVWNIQLGRALTGTQVAAAVLKRSQIFDRMHDFMEKYEFLIVPVNQVTPFAIEQEYPTEINGVKMNTYLDWMRSCSAITVTGHPAISVPCGFTPDGLPVGVQIIGRYRDERGLLQFAHAFEQRTRTSRAP
jgi:amidase